MNSSCDRHKSRTDEMTFAQRRFSAQAQYAEGILRSSLGHIKESIRALESALEADPDYAPAILSMGSVEYQRGRNSRGKKLLLSLVFLPSDSAEDGESDLATIVDEAGDFLIQTGNYADGLELYRAAVARFPTLAVLHQGVGCCAGHEGSYDEAIAASEAALTLDPQNQKYVNDLGWTLFQSGRLEEARQVLSRAVALDPADDLAAENLRLCMEASSKGGA